MRFIEREPVRFVHAGRLNTVASYDLVLPLIGYAIAYSVTYAAWGKKADVLPAYWPSFACSPLGERHPSRKRHRPKQGT